MVGFQAAPAQLFYDFCLDDHVPSDHLLRSGHLDFEGCPSSADLRDIAGF